MDMIMDMIKYLIKLTLLSLRYPVSLNSRETEPIPALLITT